MGAHDANALARREAEALDISSPEEDIRLKLKN